MRSGGDPTQSTDERARPSLDDVRHRRAVRRHQHGVARNRARSDGGTRGGHRGPDGRDDGHDGSRAADELDERIRHVVALARSVERLPAFWDGSDEDRDRLLEALATPDQRLNALLFATLDLEQHGASNFNGSGRPSLAERAYAREAVATGEISVTAQPLLALTNGDPVLPIAVPVHDVRAPKRRGLVIVGLKTIRMANVLAGIPLPSGSTAALVDLREGRVLVDSTAVDLCPRRRCHPTS